MGKRKRVIVKKKRRATPKITERVARKPGVVRAESKLQTHAAAIVPTTIKPRSMTERDERTMGMYTVEEMLTRGVSNNPYTWYDPALVDWITAIGLPGEAGKMFRGSFNGMYSYPMKNILSRGTSDRKGVERTDMLVESVLKTAAPKVRWRKEARSICHRYCLFACVVRSKAWRKIGTPKESKRLYDLAAKWVKFPVNLLDDSANEGLVIIEFECNRINICSEGLITSNY